MTSLLTLNNELREVQSQIIQAEQTLNAAQSAYNIAWSSERTNFLTIYKDKRAALYGGVANQYHCPTLHRPGKKRDECTAALKTWVDQNTSKQSSYLAARTETDIALKNAKAALTGLKTKETALLTQIENLQEVDVNLSTQGKTADSVMRGAEIVAMETAGAQREAIEAQTAAFTEQSKIDAQAKQTRNMIFIALGVIALIVVGVVVYRKFIAKKKKGGK